MPRFPKAGFKVGDEFVCKLNPNAVYQVAHIHRAQKLIVDQFGREWPQDRIRPATKAEKAWPVIDFKTEWRVRRVLRWLRRHRLGT